MLKIQNGRMLSLLTIFVLMTSSLMSLGKKSETPSYDVYCAPPGPSRTEKMFGGKSVPKCMED